MSLYEERKNRIDAAIRMEDVDKIPVISGAVAYAAALGDITLEEYVSDMEACCTATLKTVERMGNIDGVQGYHFSPEILPLLWLSEVCVPGKELGKNEEWQIHEKELITQDDYKEIIADGFPQWQQKFFKEKLGDTMAKAAPYFQYDPIAKQRGIEAGIFNIREGVIATPFEMFCGGRSLTTFFMDDLIGAPNLVDEVFKVTHEFTLKNTEDLFRSEAKPYGVWIGGWRATPGMLSPEMFERFSWKYYKEMVDLCISYGVVPIMHLDSNWTPGLHYFKEFPAGKCIMALDGKTDIFSAKEVVGDKMCIMGDVPAELFAFGKPEEVYNYIKDRATRIGPKGYMICSGCDIPFNAKYENVKMMAKVADDLAKR